MGLPLTPAIAQFSFSIKQGADWVVPWTLLKDDGTPMDITGWSMTLTIRKTVSSPTPLLTLDSQATTGSRMVLGGSAGTIDWIFARADTALLSPSGLSATVASKTLFQLGVHDWQFTNQLGDVGYFTEGPVILDPAVTQ